jgi:predicted acyltransferase
MRDGETFGRIFAHTLWRSLVLIGLAVFLTTGTKKQPDFTFSNVLAQIGLGYTFVFLLVNWGLKVQLAAIATIALGYWAAFAMFPLPGDSTNFAALGVNGDTAAQAVLPGFFGHWSMNENFAAHFDRWFLNLFPRESTFVFNAGGYQTLNFIPAIITMSLGLLAGEALRSERSETQKLKWLLVSGGVCLGLGLLAGATVCPIIKRIWTPSWALYSGGIVLWALAFFNWAIDIRGWKAWTKPLVVVGMNSIAIYVAYNLLGGWLRSIGRTYLGGEIFDGAYGPFWSSLFVMAALWLMCLWLYRRKIFLKI